jgi:hypothetical protein
MLAWTLWLSVKTTTLTLFNKPWKARPSNSKIAISWVEDMMDASSSVSTFSLKHPRQRPLESFFRPSPLGFRQVDHNAYAKHELQATIESCSKAITAHWWTQSWG